MILRLVSTAQAPYRFQGLGFQGLGFFGRRGFRGLGFRGFEMVGFGGLLQYDVVKRCRSAHNHKSAAMV